MAVLGRVDGLGRDEDLRGFQRTVYRTYWFILSEEEGSERAENLSNFLVYVFGRMEMPKYRGYTRERSC